MTSIKDYENMDRIETRGRKKITDRETKRTTINFCCTPSQKKMIHEAAAAMKISVSEYICMVLFNR